MLVETHSFSMDSCGINSGVLFSVTANAGMRRRALVCHNQGGFGTRGNIGCHYLIFSLMRCGGKGRGRMVAFCMASSGGRLPIHLSLCLGFNSTGTFLERVGKGHRPLASVVRG